MLASASGEPVPQEVPAADMRGLRRHWSYTRFAEVLWADGIWRPCEVEAWARGQQG